MSLSGGSLCCCKERACYPGWGFSAGTRGSRGRLSSSARSQNAPGSSRITSIGRNLKVPYARRETASGAAQADAPIDRGDGGVNCAFGAQT